MGDPAWLAEARDSEPSAVYLLWGDDVGATRNALDALREVLLGPPHGTPGMESFNHERFDAPHVPNVRQVLNACAQLPVAAARRLVEVHQPEEFAAQARGAGGDEQHSSTADALEALIAYFDEPSPSTTLVLSCPTVAGTSRLIKVAKKSAAVVDLRFAVARDSDARVELETMAEDKGHRLEPGVAAAIVEAVGPARTDWESAYERCVDHAGSGGIIRLADVQAVVARTREQDVFELTDAVGRRDSQTALAAVERLFGANERDTGVAMRTFALLVWQMRRLMVARSAADPARALGVPPFVARNLVDQARRFRARTLLGAYQDLSALDAALKGGAMVARHSPKLAIQRWVLQVCA